MRSLGQMITEEVLGTPAYKVGSIVMINGRKAKITGGQWWGTHGLSNHWHWQFFAEDGTLDPKDHAGYGEEWPVIKA